MSVHLTPKQKQVLDALEALFLQRGYMPSVREIAAWMGLSVATIHQHLRALEAKGRISSDGSPRGLAVLPSSGRRETRPARVEGEVRNGRVVRMPARHRRHIGLPLELSHSNLSVLQVVDDALANLDFRVGDFMLYEVNTGEEPRMATPMGSPEQQGRILALIRPL